VKNKFLSVLLVWAGLQYSTISPAAPPQDQQWVPRPWFTDEFDAGALDRTKWYNYDPLWFGRFPGYFARKNVAVADNELDLTTALVTDPAILAYGYQYSTAAVKSTKLVLYGYFEMRAKPMKSGATSAFWFYNHTPTLWTEIDVFEIAGNLSWAKQSYMMNAHVFIKPGTIATTQRPLSYGATWYSPYVLADEYHIYALEWDEYRIKWYVDGEVVRTLYNAHWKQPLNMMFDSEIMADWLGLPSASDLPSTFHIDYVRSWARISPFPFSFTAVTGVDREILLTSNAITVTGISAPAPISIVNGSYSINGGAYTTSPGLVLNGQTITVQLASSNRFSTETNATLTIGGVSGTFSATTLARPGEPVNSASTRQEASESGTNYSGLVAPNVSRLSSACTIPLICGS
jgi:beta-glucanase (GH16 family)